MLLKNARIGLAIMGMMIACAAMADATLAQGALDARPSQTTAPEEPALPPIVSFSRSNSGWTVNFSFAAPVTEIQWGPTRNGRFESTGFASAYDPRTRRPMANTVVEIDEKPATIYVRYADLNGNWVGPFAIQFDPTAEIKRQHRAALETNTRAWLVFRHDVPNIIYYTHVSGYRCGVQEFRIGLDKEVPDQIVELAPCDARGPDTHIWIKPSVSFVSAQLVYYDGTVSKVKIFSRASSTD